METIWCLSCMLFLQIKWKHTFKHKICNEPDFDVVQRDDVAKLLVYVMLL